MSAQAHEPLPRALPLDPASTRGRDAAAALGRISASVIERLIAEGRPVPDHHHDISH